MKKFFSIILKIVLFPLVAIENFVVWIYKIFISPLLPHACRFYPTCSNYMLVAIKEYGAVKGFFLGLKRIFKCNPFCKGGFDFVKPNIKGNIKWIL